MRWLKRIALGLLATFVVAVVGAVILVHTDFGRELARRQIDAALADAFVGGGHVGRLEGSPFGELVARDVTLNNPDGTPAVHIETLRTRIHLFDLAVHRVSLDELIAEDVEVIVKRDADGTYALAHALKPKDEPSRWDIDLGRLEIQRAHVMIDTGKPQLGTVNLDDVSITGSAEILRAGIVAANVRLHGAWRERAAPVDLATALYNDSEHLFVPALLAQVGAANVAVRALAIAKRPSGIPVAAADVEVYAPQAEVMRLVGVDIRDDVALRVVSMPTSVATTQLAILGTFGKTPVRARIAADVDGRNAVGRISTGDFDVARLTRGAFAAMGGGDLDFDVTATDARFPVGRVAVHGHTHGSIESAIAAQVASDGRAFQLEHGTLRATSSDLARVGGRATPVHGSAFVELAANGALWPDPDMTVTGTVEGRRLRMRDVALDHVRLAIDATQLPRRPRGTASLRAENLVQKDMRIAEISADAANRVDGRVDVSLRSRPATSPWLVELAALVTPPGDGDTVIVDLERHRVRTPQIEWSGTGGRVTIDPRRVELRDFRSHAGSGSLALAGTFMRTTGDVTATVDAREVHLGSILSGRAGVVSARGQAARTGGLWTGNADVTGSGFALDGDVLGGHATVALTGTAVTIDANVRGSRLGDASVVADLARPETWRVRGRSAIRRASLTLHDVDLGRLAAMAGRRDVVGTAEGQLEITATTANGSVRVRGLVAPQTSRIGAVDGELRLAQTSATELTPSLALAIAGVGKATATAQLALPARPLDPAAWRATGLAAVRGATVQVRDVVLDPSTFARFNIQSMMRGRGSADVTIGAGASTAKATIDVADLRGTPLAKPVQAHVEAELDGKTATAAIDITAKGQPVALLDVHARIPVTMAQLRGDPRVLRTLPLTATVTASTTSAPLLLAVFGRSEIQGGSIAAKATIGGTIAAPTATAHVEGANLAVPPGIHGKPVKMLDKLAVDGSWDGHHGKLTITGSERDGTLEVVAEGSSLQTATARIAAKRFDLAPLLAFAPGPAGGSAGTLDARLAVRGFDPRTAQVSGELHLADARVPIAPTVGTMRDAKLDVVIGQHDIGVKVAGKLGTGSLTLDGAIALDGVNLTGGKAKLVLRGVSPIGALEPAIDANVDAKLARDGTRWTADLVVDNGTVNIPRRSGEKLKPVGAPADLHLGHRPTRYTSATPATAPPAHPIIVANITIHDTAVRSSEVRATVRGKLTVTADADRIGVLGSVETTRGDVDLFDRRYQIDHAVVSFDGTTDPRIDVRIVHDFPDVTTITDVRGRLSKPRLVLSSNPGMYTDTQLLGFLLGGEPGGDPTAGSARDKITGAGTSLVANQIGGLIKQALPFDVDVIRYEAASVRSSAAITVGSWITHELFFAFRQHLDARHDENSSEGTLQYWLTLRTSVEATIGDRGYDGVDVLWRKRY